MRWIFRVRSVYFMFSYNFQVYQNASPAALNPRHATPKRHERDFISRISGDNLNIKKNQLFYLMGGEFNFDIQNVV